MPARLMRHSISNTIRIVFGDIVFYPFILDQRYDSVLTVLCPVPDCWKSVATPNITCHLTMHAQAGNVLGPTPTIPFSTRTLPDSDSNNDIVMADPIEDQDPPAARMQAEYPPIKHDGPSTCVPPYSSIPDTHYSVGSDNILASWNKTGGSQKRSAQGQFEIPPSSSDAVRRPLRHIRGSIAHARAGMGATLCTRYLTYATPQADSAGPKNLNLSRYVLHHGRPQSKRVAQLRPFSTPTGYITDAE